MKPTMTEEERILTLEEKVARLQFDVYALQSKMDLRADRKTENSSEKPNNCEDCRHWYTRKDIYDLDDAYCELFYDNAPCKYEPKDEPTISKMEQVEDEPKYEMGMGTLKCDNCSEYGSFKCTKCDGEMYFKRLEPKDEPQSDDVFDYCPRCGMRMLSKWYKDEPQTDCAWKKGE